MSDPSLGESGRTDYVIQSRFPDSEFWYNEAFKQTFEQAVTERDWLSEHNPTASFRVVVRKIVTTYSLP